MNINEISPYVRRAMHSQMNSGFLIGQRVIFDYEIIHIAYGKMRINIGNKDYICQKGDIILLRPGIPHTLSSVDDIAVSQPHIHFDVTYDEHSEKVYITFKDIDKFTDEEKTWIRKDIFEDMALCPIIKISDQSKFLKTFYEVIDVFYKKTDVYQLSCKAKMIELIETIIKDNAVIHEKPQADIALPELIRHYIDYSFKNVITLDSLEKQFNYSKFHIGRVFFDHVGTTVIKYYNEKRVKYAKAMLSSGASVSEVVEELNFSSISAFSRYFKTAVGCSPSEYRKIKK